MQLRVKLNLKTGSFIAISGESGSGKSTLLRILAGLEEATGEISVGDAQWQGKNFLLPPQKRDIGFVFQDYALFENMNVLENLLFVVKDKALAEELLELTHLSALKNRYPNTLSGGQKQRVALCRALMKRPKLLLLDEPLSALDPKIRTQLQGDILKLHKRFKTTTLMVSHDPSEIYRLAESVVLLDKGFVQEVTTPKKLFLKTQGSQKFALQGEIVEIISVDVIFIAVVAIGQQLVEVVLDRHEAKMFHAGDSVKVSTKAFAPTLTKLL